MAKQTDAGTATKRRRLTPEEIEARAEREKSRAAWLRLSEPAKDAALKFAHAVRGAKTEADLRVAIRRLFAVWPLRSGDMQDLIAAMGAEWADKD